MRRLVTETSAYLVRLARTASDAWDAFFFRPADPTSLGLIRLIVGLLAFWSLLVYGIDLFDFLGSDGWADPAVVRFVQGSKQPYGWSFWMWLPDAALRPVWLIALVATGLFAAGLFSRVTAVVAWVVLVSTARRVPVSLFGFDQVLSTWVLYLAATGASGQAVSLDRFLERYKGLRGVWNRTKRPPPDSSPLATGAPEPTVSANLALRLIQLHLCLVYGMAGLAKLQGPTWWNGTAIWGLFAAGEFRVIDFTWLALFPWLLNVFTHTALALEVAYPAVIWNRTLRPLVLFLVVVLHLGIGLSAPGLIEFAVAMIAANLAFVPGEWLRSLATGVDPSASAGKVLYDGACPRCRASMAIIKSADPGRVIEPVDLTAVAVETVHPSLTREACMRSMHVVRRDGRVTSGFDAVVQLGWWTPLFWPCAALGGLPGVRQLGRRVYQKVADSRPRDVPCTDEVCGIHAGPRG